MGEADRWAEAWEEEVAAHAETRGQVELWRERFHKLLDVVILLVVIVVVMVVVVAAGSG